MTKIFSMKYLSLLQAYLDIGIFVIEIYLLFVFCYLLFEIMQTSGARLIKSPWIIEGKT